MTGQIQITLLRSPIGLTQNQRDNLRGLGLMRREAVVVREDTASVRGMIRKLLHLVDVRRPEAKAKKLLGSDKLVEIVAAAEAPAAKKPARKKMPAKKKKES